MRADALRNRERIIAAARETMVESGAEVSLDEIARRAGVGNATLYRHFADRRELIHHVTLSVMARTADRAESALAEESDAFQALRRFVHAAVEERIGALCPLLSDSIDLSHPDLLAARERLEAAVEAVMGAARDSGQLRTDIAVGDLMVAITQLTRPLPGSGCIDFDGFVHRHLQLFLDGLLAPARSELPGTAATLDDLRQRRP
ncbi:TetR/AcrR family transcriptional regulator [Streptomyces sp. NPDC101227]|uniref:TetR/AcrR family transcriptional regulator n=1 Tax=Streptomyces sp. NPDC101227 TaxID=3366136 RepID=UPI003802A884